MTLEGYVFAQDNSGYLNGALITVLDAESRLLFGEAYSDREGFFALGVPRDRDFLVRVSKPAFLPAEGAASSRNLAADKTFFEASLARAPGYRLEVTLARERAEDQEEVDAITGSLIELYNNTEDTTVLTLASHPSPYFSIQLEQGNHYTLLIRSPGYFTKRIETFVNIDGCILCMDGVSEIGPGVSDNLSYGNEVGTLLANVELKPMLVDAAIRVNNIYYDYKESTIRRDAAYELDKVVELLRVNPSILVELGSHSDSRGQARYNANLSQLRAQAAVEYILTQGIAGTRLSARGYGESTPVNECVDDVPCSEEQYAQNRRTELKITGFTHDPFAGNSLADIIAEERLDALLAEVMAAPEVRIPVAPDTGENPGDPSLTPGVGSAVAKTRPPASAGPRYGVKPAVAFSPEVTASAAGDPEIIEPPGVTDATSGARAGPDSVLARDAARVVVPEQSLTNVAPLTLATGAKFSGYRVLVFESSVSLADANGELFFKFGTLREDRLVDGSFGYMSGAFATEIEARSYLANVVTLFPASRLLRYVNGFITDNAQ